MLSSCVHPSASEAGIIPKWLNAWSEKQCRTIAHGLAHASYDAKNLEIIPPGAPNVGGVGKYCHRRFMSICFRGPRHDGALAEKKMLCKCHDVINNVDCR